MQGYMNQEALKLTIEKKKPVIGVDQEMLYGIKERQVVFVQKVIDIRIDDDQDSYG